MGGLYIGALTGTSADAIDTVAACFDKEIKIIAQYSDPLPDTTREDVEKLQQGVSSLAQAAKLETAISLGFAGAVKKLIGKCSSHKEKIKAVGLHGQTILHKPCHNPPFTVQLGDPNIVAAETGLAVVADFRRSDIAAGGQGAPLTPLFHHAAFADPRYHRAIVNIGGIANVSILAGNNRPQGFDCGPGNVLINRWIGKRLGRKYDYNGEWAASGHCSEALLEALLKHEFFQRKPPKSTCTSDFSDNWLNRTVAAFTPDPATVQATLTELTAVCINRAIQTYAPNTQEIYLCGGGALNTFLTRRITALVQVDAPERRVANTERLGVDAKRVEAAAFAWLAQQRFLNRPIDLSSITGARRKILCGTVYLPPL